MKTSSLLLACILVAGSVRAVQGKYVDFVPEDHDTVDEETLEKESMVEQQLPGKCWICEWILNKVKKSTGNSTAEELKDNLLSVCEQIGFLQTPCRHLVKKYLGTLIEELSTTDSVRTICVNIKACKDEDH